MIAAVVAAAGLGFGLGYAWRVFLGRRRWRARLEREGYVR
jgi:hypothetical protein